MNASGTDPANLYMHWLRHTDYSVYVGDSNQCIYRFAGSVPEAFINLKHDFHKHLDQSYRLPTAVHAYAERIISRAADREHFPYKPVTKDMEMYRGEGRVVNQWEPDLSLPGTHMILGRCNYHIRRWIYNIMDAGHIWHNPYRPEDLFWNPTKTASWRAARTYLELMEGREVHVSKLKHMVSMIIAKDNMDRGAKKQIKNRWTSRDDNTRIDLFDLQGLGFTDLFINKPRLAHEVIKVTGTAGEIIKRSGTYDKMKDVLLKEPKIIAGTVHSVKGGEASHVWVDVSLAPIIYKEIDESPRAFWDEARVAFVAATRARETLGLIHMSGKWSPLLPEI